MIWVWLLGVKRNSSFIILLRFLSLVMGTDKGLLDSLVAEGG